MGTYCPKSYYGGTVEETNLAFYDSSRTLIERAHNTNDSYSWVKRSGFYEIVCSSMSTIDRVSVNPNSIYFNSFNNNKEQRFDSYVPNDQQYGLYKILVYLVDGPGNFFKHLGNLIISLSNKKYIFYTVSELHNLLYYWFMEKNS